MVYVTLYLDGTTHVRVELANEEAFHIWCETMKDIMDEAAHMTNLYPDPSQPTVESRSAMVHWLVQVRKAEEAWEVVPPSILDVKAEILSLLEPDGPQNQYHETTA
jgi:hypothetical protein